MFAYCFPRRRCALTTARSRPCSDRASFFMILTSSRWACGAVDPFRRAAVRRHSLRRPAAPAALHQTLGVVRDDENPALCRAVCLRLSGQHIRTRLVFLQHAGCPDLPSIRFNRFSTERFSVPATWLPRFRPVCIRLFLLNATRTQSMRSLLMLSRSDSISPCSSPVPPVPR